MTTDNAEPVLILIPGYWLGAWAWDEVVEHLHGARSRCLPLTLPGLDAKDSNRTWRTVDDQARMIEDILHEETLTGARCILVAHSGANAPVTLVLDHCPELVTRVVWVDSGPLASASATSPDHATEATGLPLPSFDDLGRVSSLTGLTQAHLERFRTRAVTEPAGVVDQPLRPGNSARLAVPTTMVCCSISSQQIRDLARASHPMFTEVARLKDVEFLDLPTGHWPMWSRPMDLATLLADIAAREHH